MMYSENARLKLKVPFVCTCMDVICCAKFWKILTPKVVMSVNAI